MTKKVNLSCVLSAIILFFLPWVQVSCQEGIVQQTGIQAMRGDVVVVERGVVQQPRRPDETITNDLSPAWLTLGVFVLLCAAAPLALWALWSTQSWLDVTVVLLSFLSFMLVIFQLLVGFPLSHQLLSVTEKSAFDDELRRSFLPAFYALLIALLFPLAWRMADKFLKKSQ